MAESPPAVSLAERRARRAALAEVPAPPPRTDSWTTPPGSEGGLEAAEARRRDRAAELERDLARTAQARAEEEATRAGIVAALETARADLRASRAAREADAAALSTLRGELDAERVAHAVTRARAASLAEALVAARARLAAQATAVTTTADLERRAREQAEAAAEAPRRPPAETARLLDGLEAAARSLRAAAPGADAPPAATAESPPAATAERLPAATAESPPAATAERLPAATAESPPAATAESPPAAAAESPPAATAESPPAATAESPSAAAASSPPGRAAGRLPDRALRHALVALARADPLTAGRLILALLPAHGAALEARLSYDLTVKGLGTFAVTSDGRALSVRRLLRPRGRREAAFHLRAHPLALAELLAGRRRRRPRARALRPLAASALSLQDVARAGARPEPALIYAALPFAIPPEWTRGHAFTVAQQVSDPWPRTWYLTVRDGEGLAVGHRPPTEPADATVSMTRAAFDRLLRGEPPAGGALPVVRGDRAPVATLKAWTDRLRGA